MKIFLHLQPNLCEAILVAIPRLSTSTSGYPAMLGYVASLLYGTFLAIVGGSQIKSFTARSNDCPTDGSMVSESPQSTKG